MVINGDYIWFNINRDFSHDLTIQDGRIWDQPAVSQASISGYPIWYLGISSNQIGYSIFFSVYTVICFKTTVPQSIFPPKIWVQSETRPTCPTRRHLFGGFWGLLVWNIKEYHGVFHRYIFMVRLITYGYIMTKWSLCLSEKLDNSQNNIDSGSMGNGHPSFRSWTATSLGDVHPATFWGPKNSKPGKPHWSSCVCALRKFGIIFPEFNIEHVTNNYI
jgi:hypothetical protein